MLGELIIALLTAGDHEDREWAYHNLERVGVDHGTADMMAAEYYKPEVKQG